MLHDCEPAADDFRAAVLAGLSASPRTLPSRFFYDAAGSALFERICEQPEYYLTRTELQILDDHLPDIADRLGPDVLLIELGSGAGVKTRRLLDAMHDPAGYVPIDISRNALRQSVQQLQQDFPGLEVLPVCADYSQRFDVPETSRNPRRRVVYFPGSTIGNLDAPAARRLFATMRRLTGDRSDSGSALDSGGGSGSGGGGLLLGVDRVKPADVLVPAYDDAAGVTAAFNLNLLHRINAELDGDFDPDAWSHVATWNPEASRMESHLRSDRDQAVHIADRKFHFRGGETIWTESSYKYTRPMIHGLAEGFTPGRPLDRRPAVVRRDLLRGDLLIENRRGKAATLHVGVFTGSDAALSRRPVLDRYDGPMEGWFVGAWFLFVLAFGCASIVVTLLLLGFWIWMLVDAVQRDFADPNEKLVWVVVLALTAWIGALIYFFVGRSRGTKAGVTGTH